MKKLILFSCILVLEACSTHEEIFTSNVTVNFNVHELSSVLSDESIYSAKLTGKDHIVGFLNTSFFTFQDSFTSASVVPGSIKTGKVVHEDAEQLVVFSTISLENGEKNYQLNDVILSSTGINSAPRFTLYDKKDNLPGKPLNTRGFRTYTNAFFLSQAKGWIFCQYSGANSSDYPEGLRTYRINGASIEIISTIPNRSYVPVDAYFKNDDIGWLIATNFSIPYTYYFFKTTDGGVTWNLVSADDYKVQVKRMIFIDDQNFVLFGEEGILRTSNSGETWRATFFESPDRNHSVSDVTKASDSNILYASIFEGLRDYNAIHSIHRSTDNGKTWTELDKKTLNGNLSFSDERHGIAYSFTGLEYTANGGKTWDLILYSFPLTKID
ncbi:MAG TPA: hypothetical protein PKL56_11945 [Cyclobacteriaceae bacterium]|nr:hypothetical protein [Cyclobacteriaceae bacterium]HMV07506.1 hypothetical protein [Cyclobacteriaceae bacterium]HMW99139.1 hypothetical protein [Cyclobacteriaceae bacterium]HMX48228.1 hypothetical protein [Cyclobacteriaceae bacterium]HMY95033.1 hypothetical protein [Cyclobacteriaceae bacterium]